MASIRATQLKSVIDHRLRQNGVDPVEIPIVADHDCDDIDAGVEHGNLRGYYAGESIGMCVFDHKSAHTLFHEVGHAWTDKNLSNSHREQLAREMNLPTWNSHDYSWEDRANERASDVFAWKMMGGNRETRLSATANEEYERQWRTMTSPLPPDHLQERK